MTSTQTTNNKYLHPLRLHYQETINLQLLDMGCCGLFIIQISSLIQIPIFALFTPIRWIIEFFDVYHPDLFRKRNNPTNHLKKVENVQSQVGTGKTQPISNKEKNINEFCEFTFRWPSGIRKEERNSCVQLVQHGGHSRYENWTRVNSPKSKLTSRTSLKLTRRRRLRRIIFYILSTPYRSYNFEFNM